MYVVIHNTFWISHLLGLFNACFELYKVRTCADYDILALIITYTVINEDFIKVSKSTSCVVFINLLWYSVSNSLERLRGHNVDLIKFLERARISYLSQVLTL